MAVLAIVLMIGSSIGYFGAGLTTSGSGDGVTTQLGQRSTQDARAESQLASTKATVWVVDPLQPEKPGMSHANGRQVFYNTDLTVRLERSVDVWRSDDGRYRVVVRSLDGTEATEEVEYDGRSEQLVLITGPSGEQSAYLVEGSEHFAIDDLRDSGSTKAGGLVTSSEINGVDGKALYATEAVTRLSGQDESKLSITLPDGVQAIRQEDIAEPIPETLTTATGSASKTWYDWISGDKCMYGYNNRNSTSNFFTANSQKKTPCSWFDVATYNAGWGSSSCGGNWQGSGPTHSTYSSWTGYFETLTPSYSACSRHAAWDSGWSIIIAWDNLVASVEG